MKRTSKKLLSLFLAVVMIVTSCSVGFTAFAKDSDEKTLWNNVTESEDAFDALSDTINTLVPTILGIKINEKPLYETLGVSNDATLQEVVAGASPLLISALQKGDKNTIIKNYENRINMEQQLGVPFKEEHLQFYSYLDSEKSSMSFYSLYTLCRNFKDDTSVSAEFKQYCTETYAKLEEMLAIGYGAVIAGEKAAASSKNTASEIDEAYANLRTAVTSAKIKGNISVTDVGNTLYNGTPIKDLKGDLYDQGIAICNETLKAAGATFEATNPAEALMYYFVTTSGYAYNQTGNSANARSISYANALLYAKLAEQYGTGIPNVTIPTAKTDNPIAFANEVYNNLFDMAGKVNGPGSAKTYDAFCSSQFEAINIGVLVMSGKYGDEAAVKKLINDSKISAADLADLQAHSQYGAPEVLMDYIDSDDCTLSSYAKQMLVGLEANQSDFSLFNNAVNEGTGDSYLSTNVYKTQAQARSNNANYPVVSFINDIIAGIIVKEINTAGIASATFVAKPSLAVRKIIDDKSAVSAESLIKEELDKYVQYDAEGNVIPIYYYNCDEKDIPSPYKNVDSLPMTDATKMDYVKAVNTALNDLIGGFLEKDENAPSTGPINLDVKKILEGFMESNVVLFDSKKEEGVLYSLWQNLYNTPIETVFNLLPTLVILIEEVIAPILLHDENDYGYEYSKIIQTFFEVPEKPAKNAADIEWTLYNVHNTIYGLTVYGGDTKVGLATSFIDLNKTLPALLAQLSGDTAAVNSLVDTYGKFIADNKLDESIFLDENGKSKINKDIPMLTGIYVADKAIAELNFNDLFKKMDPTLAKGLSELISEVIGFAYEATQEYVTKYGNNEDYYRYTIPSGTAVKQTTQKGLNNIAVALPILLDTIGQKFKAKYGINTDWTTLYDGKFETREKDFNGDVVKQTYNTRLEEFKATATKTGVDDAAEKLDLFVEAFIGTWLDCLLDVLNDTLTTNNKLTDNLPLVQGLVNSIGGLGETSALTDILNGFFGLTRKDKASFTLSENSKGFVGFSKESGLFLLSNIKGIVDVIKGLTGPTPGKPSSDSNSTSTDNKEEEKKSPTLVNSSKASKKYNTNDLLTSKNVKVADSLISKLDAILKSLLDNTSLNDFTLNANDNILAGVLTTASNYLGEKNTNSLISLIDEYLKVFDTTAKDGKVDASEVYSAKNLSNIVINTYSLLGAIVQNVFYNAKTGVLRVNDTNRVIGAAVCGLISPDAISVRLTSQTGAAKDLSGKAKWSEVKSIGFNVANGDKNGFYSALGESLGIVAGIIGAVLAYSYTDATRTDNLYSKVLYPVLSAISKHTGAPEVLAPNSFNSLSGSDQFVQGVLAPLSNILSQFYKAPVSFLLNLVASLGDILSDDAIVDIVNGAMSVANGSLNGFTTVIEDFMKAPDLVKYLASKASDVKLNGKQIFSSHLALTINLEGKDIFVNLINGINIGSLNMTIGKLVNLKPIDWKALATADTPGKVLLLVLGYLIDVVLSSPVILGLIKDAAPELVKLFETLDPGKILAILNAILDVIHSPVEAYWTFKEYAGKITNTFVYPRGITAAEADMAVDNLDQLVKNVFPLLKDLGVLDYEDLNSLVGSLLYKNELLTSMTTGIYGAVYDAVDKAGLSDLLKAIGLDLSPSGIAEYLMDDSYGKTYSSAAATLKKAKSWKKVKKLNWGFKDGTDKAQTGFINGLAAVLRPINSIVSILLADGAGLKGLEINADTKAEIIKMIKTIDVKKNPVGSIAKESENGCDLNLEIKNGILKLTIDSNNSEDNSVLKCDLAAVAGTLIDQLSDVEFGLGTNGYESAVIPLLEAFLCKDVKTYDEYLDDYAEAKDNLFIDVLEPLFGFVNDVLDAPGNTLMAALPNVAYFIDSNGLAQAVANLLAPITGKKGLVGILKKNGVNVDQIIKSITGKSLGKVVTDAIGINVKLNLNINDLSKCNIQDIVIPLVNSLLKKNNIGIKIPAISFAQIASHGKIVTADSAAMNDKGEYERLMVVADKGEMFVALLRYVGDVLIKNAKALNKLLGGIDAIKKNKTIKDILNCVFASLQVATKDDIVRAIFYFLTQNGAKDTFFDYRNFISKSYDFSFGNMDEDFCRKLAPMLDGLISGLLADKGGVLGLIEDLAYKDDVISSIACGLYGAVEGVNLDGIGSLSELLAKTGIDFTSQNVAKLLTDKRYGKTYASAAATISKAGSWAKVNKDSLKWGVKDRDSFLNALAAVLRPIYGVLDVLLNNANLNLFNIVSIPGSNGYTSFIVPLLEAFGVYNIKTQYDYRQDCLKAYDSILLDILNPLLDKVEDILNAPIEMVADILPNLSLFFANNGLLQLIDNLLAPVTALLDAVKPIINVNVVLDVLGVDVNALLGKIGINTNVKVDVYDLQATLEPVIGAENVVSLLNGVLGIIKIGGNPLGLKLPEIDWYKLASHGEVSIIPSQVATFGTRMYVTADQDETLIAVLRYLIDTINYKDNYNTIVNLISGLLGDGVSDSISGVIDQVLGMLQGDADTVIESLVDLLQSIAG